MSTASGLRASLPVSATYSMTCRGGMDTRAGVRTREDMQHSIQFDSIRFSSIQFSSIQFSSWEVGHTNHSASSCLMRAAWMVDPLCITSSFPQHIDLLHTRYLPGSQALKLLCSDAAQQQSHPDTHITANNTSTNRQSTSTYLAPEPGMLLLHIQVHTFITPALVTLITLILLLIGHLKNVLHKITIILRG